MQRYPRDLVGYGRSLPDPHWPGDARIAVQFVINYEEGGENCILHGDAASEAFLSDIVDAKPWVGRRHMNMESTFEYGARAGFWRLLRLFTERDLTATVFAVASALTRHPEPIAAMKAANWEIASHGLKWIDYSDFGPEDEREHIREAIRLHTELVGARPLGFYQGRCSPHTLELVIEESGFLYSADSYADDLPYWVDGPKGPHLLVPYTLDANDMCFSSAQGFTNGEQFFGYLKDSFDTLYAEGETAPKMLSVGLHCRLSGRPGRAAALARFLDYVLGHDRVWIAKRVEIARHWLVTHPPRSLLPSRMSRAIFIERFGDVFEHTPQLARAVHAAGLSPQHDSLEGLHAALSAALYGLPREAQIALVRAHPDLAGRVALANQLTADSKQEQVSAGLDQLTAEELQQFTLANERYRARFAFPFVMAIKGRTKSEILAAFATRLQNDPETEFAEALRQIDAIARLRLADRLVP
jgi:OHCU decarboxylase